MKFVYLPKMNKKSQASLWMIVVHLSILIIVAISLGAYINSINKSDIMERKAILADVKLMIEAVHAIPGPFAGTLEADIKASVLPDGQSEGTVHQNILASTV